MNRRPENRRPTDRRPRLATALAAATLAAPLLAGPAAAEETALRCRLYMAVGTEVADEIVSASTKSALRTVRRSGVCVFADGAVADKQFVMTQHASDGGARGINHGYSVYTFEGGDALTLAFEGGWDEDGYRGEYELLSGTAAWEGASGTGTITGASSPWEGTEVVDIAIDVTAAGS